MEERNHFKRSASILELALLRKTIERRSLECWGEDKKVVLLGNHPLFTDVLSQIEHFACSDDPVLLKGETGAGKELFARSLYLLNRMNGRQFLTVNCANFKNESLLESKFFGHTNGSFTGAVKDHRGVFERANGGVLFLDEVETLPLTAQGMLLRVLEAREIMPLGSEKFRHIDVRIVAATNQDLFSLVRGGLFRKDLYYRLNVLTIEVPPLRERGDDWGVLVDYYLEQLNKSEGRRKYFSEEALGILETYPWPGNVRELINVVKTGFYDSPGQVIEVGSIHKKLERRLEQKLTSGYNDTGVLYNWMIEKGKSFWEMVKKPYLNRDLNRREVKAILRMGLKEAGNYKKLAELFNIEEKDYKKFMSFLYDNRLK
ncbi:C4-dicarboxylate transport transcriptional regulatory protein DctD [bacterium BMS3Bbin03]|nr:C4-dicarboxylate transport transcriptional regulatory protein DctD [bacterium BMS3Bbin03]